MILGMNGNTEEKKVKLLTKGENNSINLDTKDYIVNFRVDKDNNLVVSFSDSGNLFKSTESLSDNRVRHTIISGEFKNFEVDESTYEGAKVYYSLVPIRNASCAKIRTINYDIVLAKMNDSLVIYLYNRENAVIDKEMVNL